MSETDARAIERLKHEYCFTIDSGAYDAWVSLFTDDGRFVRGDVDVYEGTDELAAFATEVFDAAFERSAHLVTNPVVEVDGDEATGRWYLLLLAQTEDGVSFTQARYDDTFRRVDGEWRIAEVAITYGIRHET
ncbi:nuclear transport factor 2 family protein [Natronobiforma cellulositropha]|uniref:nuclear transport factor 2 family protein n=1 Tax=Natronobiforma cellulositropha TaxID=1679076 RepID=UPI0021D60E35|nr:nuclear transport factor 2 family protein [Natronobiforma cellulositropha]